MCYCLSFHLYAITIISNFNSIFRITITFRAIPTINITFGKAFLSVINSSGRYHSRCLDVYFSFSLYIEVTTFNNEEIKG